MQKEKRSRIFSGSLQLLLVLVLVLVVVLLILIILIVLCLIVLILILILILITILHNAGLRFVFLGLALNSMAAKSQIIQLSRANRFLISL